MRLWSLEAPAGWLCVCVLALGEGPKAGHSRTQGRGRGRSRRSKVTPTAHNHPHRAGLLPGPLSLSLSHPFNLTVPLFLALSKYPPFYFHHHRCCFFHVSAFILSISFHLYNSLPLHPLLHFIFLSLSPSFSGGTDGHICRLTWTAGGALLASCCFLIFAQNFSPFLSEQIIHNQPTKDVDVS